ncbi:hypothetical protein [Streptosporangium sp. OZ121]
MTSTEGTSAGTASAAVGITARTGSGAVSAGPDAEGFVTDT